MTEVTKHTYTLFPPQDRTTPKFEEQRFLTQSSRKDCVFLGEEATFSDSQWNLASVDVT